MADVGDHCGNRLAGDGFLDGPEKLDSGFRSAENDGRRIDAVAAEAEGVRDADILAVAGELHEEDRGTILALHAVRGGEGKAESCACVARGVGEDLVNEALGQIEELSRIRMGFVLTGKTRVLFDAFNAGAEILQHSLFRKALHS
jgi:hypothetical protein